MIEAQTWSEHRKVAIVGVGTTKQGIHPGKTSYQLVVEALKDALEDAGITDKNRIDGLLGARQFDGSGVDAVILSRYLGLNPRVTGSLDYGTCGFTFHYGSMLIASGMCRLVACVYGRNPPDSMTGLSGAITYDANHGYFNAGGTAALGISQHMATYGTGEEALGRVVVASRKHARLNPISAWTEPLSLDDYLAEPYLIWPFRNSDICKVNAGAVVILIARDDIARDLRKKPVWLHAAGRQQGVRGLENDNQFLCHGMRSVAEQVYGAAGMAPKDIDTLFVYDAASSAVLHTLENYGFCDEGGSGEFVKDGRIELGGALPVNPNGGHLSEGYLVGWLHHAELARQLRGECGARQVEGARVAQYCTTGGFREHYCSSIYVAD